MPPPLPLRIERRLILALLALQVGLASVFIADFLVDVFRLRINPPSYTSREVMQIAAWVGLMLSLLISTLFFLSLMRERKRLERTADIARGAFADLIADSFDAWGLTPSEREVAMLAIKGFTNAEIARITGKAEGTVKAQSNAVFRKAGVGGRVQLICHFTETLLDDALPTGAATTGPEAPPAPAAVRP